MKAIFGEGSGMRIAAWTVLLLLAFPAAAHAHGDQLPGQHRHGVTVRAADAPSTPTPSEQAQATDIVHRYWGGHPSCGEPSITIVPMEAKYGGLAYPYECRTELSSAVDWAGNPIGYCEIMIHEYGHHILGLTYFALTNPADPAHAPTGYAGQDGLGVMQATVPDVPACHAMDLNTTPQTQVAQVQPPPRPIVKAKPKPRHHKARKRHHHKHHAKRHTRNFDSRK